MTNADSPVFQLIREEEGSVSHAYQDSLGYWTIGVGHLIDGRKGGKLSEACINYILAEDVAKATSDTQELLGHTWDGLNEVRRAVLVAMCFQLGPDGLEQFTTFLKYLEQGNFKGAAADALTTKWATQTPERAQRQMKMLSTGVWVTKK